MMEQSQTPAAPQAPAALIASAWVTLVLLTWIPFLNIAAFLALPIMAVKLILIGTKIARVNGIACLVVWGILWTTVTICGILFSP